MNRRKVLFLLGGGPVTIVAGCVGSDDDPPAARDGAEQAFSGAVAPDIDVDDASHLEELFEVTVTTDATTEEQIEHEARTVADAYAALVEDGYGGERMMVYANDERGDQIYVAHVRAQWAAGYNGGNLTEDEYHARVIDALKIE